MSLLQVLEAEEHRIGPHLEEGIIVGHVGWQTSSGGGRRRGLGYWAAGEGGCLFHSQGCLDRESGEHKINTATEMKPRGAMRSRSGPRGEEPVFFCRKRRSDAEMRRRQLARSILGRTWK